PALHLARVAPHQHRDALRRAGQDRGHAQLRGVAGSPRARQRARHHRQHAGVALHRPAARGDGLLEDRGAYDRGHDAHARHPRHLQQDAGRHSTPSAAPGRTQPGSAARGGLRPGRDRRHARFGRDGSGALMALAPLSLSREIVGASTAPFVQEIDARWLMAYAAGLGETDPRYYDTTGAEGPVAPPLFPVCYEWPALLALRALATSDEMANRSVHATHDLMVYRPLRAGETLYTRARVTGLAHRRPRALLAARQETADALGLPVPTTDYRDAYPPPGLRGGTPRRHG